MHFIKKILILILIVFSHLALCENNDLFEDVDIENIFDEYAVEGTMLISSLDHEKLYIYNFKRANEPLSPASTFKITNSLIALEEGVMSDQSEIIKWNGKKYDFKKWNQDQNLKSAFKYSCLWCYQELAKRIGKEKYQKYLTLFDYGNHLLGEDVTTFWLEGGDLKITPVEQLKFLKKIYNKQLNISEKNYSILQDIMFEKEINDCKIYSKTGTATKDWIGHGWYVGYVNKKDKVWFFVTNILVNGYQDLEKRKQVTIAALKKKGVI